jgi:apolipoprotein N-acyltransferase
MLRATNTGVTAIINQRGEVLQEAEIFTTATLTGLAQGFTGATPYVRFGNSLILGISGILTFIGLLSAFRSARKTL